MIVNSTYHLGKLAQINPPAPVPLVCHEEIGFVSLQAVNGDGDIIPQQRLLRELGRHARHFKGGDILLPCMEYALRKRRIGFYAKDGPALVCSAEFVVLRPDTDQIDPRYLYHWLRFQSCNDLIPLLQGTAQKRAARADIAALSILVPSLSAQVRFAMLMDAAHREKVLAAKLLANSIQNGLDIFSLWKRALASTAAD